MCLLSTCLLRSVLESLCTSKRMNSERGRVVCCVRISQAYACSHHNPKLPSRGKQECSAPKSLADPSSSSNASMRCGSAWNAGLA